MPGAVGARPLRSLRLRLRDFLAHPARAGYPGSVVGPDGLRSAGWMSQLVRQRETPGLFAQSEISMVSPEFPPRSLRRSTTRVMSQSPSHPLLAPLERVRRSRPLPVRRQHDTDSSRSIDRVAPRPPTSPADRATRLEAWSAATGAGCRGRHQTLRRFFRPSESRPSAVGSLPGRVAGTVRSRQAQDEPAIPYDATSPAVSRSEWHADRNRTPHQKSPSGRSVWPPA